MSPKDIPGRAGSLTWEVGVVFTLTTLVCADPCRLKVERHVASPNFGD